MATCRFAASSRLRISSNRPGRCDSSRRWRNCFPHAHGCAGPNGQARFSLWTSGFAGGDRVSGRLGDSTPGDGIDVSQCQGAKPSRRLAGDDRFIGHSPGNGDLHSRLGTILSYPFDYPCPSRFPGDDSSRAQVKRQKRRSPCTSRVDWLAAAHSRFKPRIDPMNYAIQLSLIVDRQQMLRGEMHRIQLVRKFSRGKAIRLPASNCVSAQRIRRPRRHGRTGSLGGEPATPENFR